MAIIILGNGLARNSFRHPPELYLCASGRRDKDSTRPSNLERLAQMNNSPEWIEFLGLFAATAAAAAANNCQRTGKRLS